MKKNWWIVLVVAVPVVVGILAYFLWPRSYCLAARDRYGIKVPICPDGKLRQLLHISGSDLRRGGVGSVSLRATALYTVSQADRVRRASLPRLTAELFLVDARGKQTPLPLDKNRPAEEQGWQLHGGTARGAVKLPQKLHDGDYKLRARIKTTVGEGQVDLPLPLYAPARIHVLTDRPLYEPGHRVQFRALVVRARDLTPLDNRPGMWLVKDPRGTVLLEEKAPAGRWGVVAGDFLLDRKAATGRWTVSWRSGSDSGSATVRVEPFKLPRFRVSAAPDRSSYGVGQKPRVTGSVVYASGAPVQGAKVGLHWTVSGSWPPPADWQTTGLPRRASTDATGRFSVQLPQVPADLRGRATLSARVSAVDPAGDRVDGAVSVLLSKDAIQVSTVTPLANGLVKGFNNRLYLRVTTADGSALEGAKINVRRAWLGTDPGIETELDADSVGRIQIDPGPPVNVVIPPMPVRRVVGGKGEAVRRTEARELAADQDASLADQLELDRWLKLIKPCGKWSTDDKEARLALRVSAAGAIVEGLSASRMGRCVLGRIKGRRLPAGQPRLYSLTFEFEDPELPSLEVALSTALGDDTPEGLTELFQSAAADARDCLPDKISGQLPWALAWRLKARARKPTVSWFRLSSEDDEIKMPPGADRCIAAALARAQLSEPSAAEAMGVAHFTLNASDEEQQQAKPQPTIIKGYELLVSASLGGKPVGQTKMRLRPGAIPELAVRAEPVLARAGTQVTVRLIRGPKFSDELPKKIKVEHLGDVLERVEATDERKRGTYKYRIPAGKKGWFSFSALGRRALVFVRAEDELTVAVSADRQRYAPGSTARLRVKTAIGQRQAAAAVGLFGVDNSLAQLATLTSPDALRVLRPKVEMTRKAFDLLDGQALALGRIRGKYAAEATVLRVSSVPKPAEIDIVINDSAQTTFDPVAELTDRFYIVLTELHKVTRAWEKSAPSAELMKPETMARLWTQALTDCAARGKQVSDAFGRKLRLHRLPADMLALTDPRQVVTVGTRLPEDTENWPRWVARRKP